MRRHSEFRFSVFLNTGELLSITKGPSGTQFTYLYRENNKENSPFSQRLH